MGGIGGGGMEVENVSSQHGDTTGCFDRVSEW